MVGVIVQQKTREVRLIGLGLVVQADYCLFFQIATIYFLYVDLTIFSNFNTNGRLLLRKLWKAFCIGRKWILYANS